MTYDKITVLVKKGLKSQVAINLYIAFVLNFIIEFCGRGYSVKEAYSYLTEHPVTFFFNMVLIFTSMSFVFLIRRRVFGLVVVSTLWAAIGITNGIMLGYRVTPFTIVDLTLLKSVFSIIGKYLTGFQQILIYIAFGIAFIVFIYFFIKGAKFKGKIKYKRNILLIALCFIGFFAFAEGALAGGAISRYFGNIANAYKDYGVPYCFTITFVDRGISTPGNYTKYTAKRAAERVLPGSNSPIKISENVKKSRPNIIFIQLESFFDPYLVKGLSFSEDPIPNFRRLMKEYTSGYLGVPVVGAGTCNTEFEAITGMNMDFFGPGEYPYQSIMKKTTCETIPANLKELGYATHAMHNNFGNFYGRNNVFANFGFDTFTSVEYMKNVIMNPIGWAKDNVIAEEILDTLNSTSSPDYIYAISVQGHGNYPTEKVDDTQHITITGIEEEGKRNAFEYYVNQINEMDQMLGKLVEDLSSSKEKTILVAYGDHLPSLGIENDQLKNHDIYKTEYIMWDNLNLKEKDMDLETYQLGAYALSRAGINNGTLMNYHQTNMDKTFYQRNMKLIQYDILYGKRYIYGQVNPYERTNLKMGIHDIYVSRVGQIGEDTYIYGGNFTDYSSAYINGDSQETEILSGSTLKVPGYALKDQDAITIRQRGKKQRVLSSSRKYIYNEE